MPIINRKYQSTVRPIALASRNPPETPDGQIHTLLNHGIDTPDLTEWIVSLGAFYHFRQKLFTGEADPLLPEDFDTTTRIKVGFYHAGAPILGDPILTITLLKNVSTVVDSVTLNVDTGGAAVKSQYWFEGISPALTRAEVATLEVDYDWEVYGEGGQPPDDWNKEG